MTTLLGGAEYQRQCRADQLNREGSVGTRIANVLSVRKMTPDELIASLTSEPSGLSLNEENVAEIIRIINDPRGLVKIQFELSPDFPAELSQVKVLLTL